jgi:hypothetical protein
VTERFPSLARCIDGDLDALGYLALADHVAHVLRPQIAVGVVGRRASLEDGFAQELCLLVQSNEWTSVD